MYRFWIIGIGLYIIGPHRHIYLGMALGMDKITGYIDTMGLQKGQPRCHPRPSPGLSGKGTTAACQSFPVAHSGLEPLATARTCHCHRWKLPQTHKKNIKRNVFSTFMYVHLDIHIYIYHISYIIYHIHKHVHIQIQIHIHIHMYVCMYVCMYVRTYVRTYVCMYVCMYYTYPNTIRVALGICREKSKSLQLSGSAFWIRRQTVFTLICLGSVRLDSPKDCHAHILVKYRLEGQKIVWAVQIP